MKNIFIIILTITSLISFDVAGSAYVSDLFLERHSGKNYDATKVISLEEILSLAEAARWSPSSHNDQPWNFIFCDRHLTPEAYELAFNSFKNIQQSWVQNVPLLVIVVVRTNQTYNGKFNEWADYDTGAAAMSISLQATDLGLMAHQIGGFDKNMIVQNFHIPYGYKPLTIIAIGHENFNNEPSSGIRSRKPLKENFFLGGWGESIPQ